MNAKHKTVVTIPTYNEKENIEELIQCIFDYVPQSHILVIDDDSPDGTASIVQCLSEKDSRVHLLLRNGRRGRGLAGIAGFKKALEMGADIVVEMDADFSHHPKYIPLMLEEIQNCDVVVGSRFVPGGKDMDRAWLLKSLMNS